MGSKSESYDEELSNGESSKGNDTSIIVNANSSSDIDDNVFHYSQSDNENDHEEYNNSKERETSSKKHRNNDSGKKKSPARDPKVRQKIDPSKTRHLWVSGVPSGTRTEQLEQVFVDYGKVLAIKIIRGSNNTLLGFVKLETIEQAQRCMEKLHKVEFRGSKIELFKERPIDKEEKKPEKIGFRDSVRKFSSPRVAPPPPIKRPAFRPPPRINTASHFRSLPPKPMGTRIHTPRIHAPVEFKRTDRDEYLHLEREKQKLKLERMKLERDKAELLKMERETRSFDHREHRLHEDKARVRSMVKRPIEDSYSDGKRYEEFARRDDFRRGGFESRNSPERKLNAGRTFAAHSGRARYDHDNSRQERYGENKYPETSKSWQMSGTWMSSNDRWNNSTYDSPRISSTISSNPVGRLHSNSDIAPTMSRGYFNSNNRRY